MKPYALYIFLACTFSDLALATEFEKPNIVVIVADDLGYADVAFNPQHPKEVSTPNLAALAKESIICRQGYVSGHVCSPTRAGLMTGRYQQRLGLYTGGEAGSGLPMNEKIFPRYLKPAGYVTCQLGKWHLGPDPEWSPALRGFDEVFGFLGRGAHDYFKLNDPKDPIYRGTTPVNESGYLTDRLGEEAIAFVDRNKANPFFLYLAFNAVHAPLQAPADEIAKFSTIDADRNALLAMGKRMDDAIGGLVAKLKKENVWENTLLFFISDNGGPLAQTANNTPLRGGKHQDYEGGIRVPFLVCWPDQLKPGECQAVVSSLDILPTAVAAVGYSPTDNQPFDGINLLPILNGEIKPPSRNLFWSAGGEEIWWAVRSGEWKLVGEKERIGLFDLSRDVSEKHDIAQQMPEKVVELTKLHDAWLAEMADPVKGGAKRYGLTGGNTKKVKKKDQKSPASPELSSSITVPRTVSESFASLLRKPWKPLRGNWEAQDNAVWGSKNPDEKQDAKLTGPSAFRSGEIECEFNMAAGSRLNLRFKTPDEDIVFRIDIILDSITITKTAGEDLVVLDKSKIALAPDTWHTLVIQFTGAECVCKLGDTKLTNTDEVFDREKAKIDFIVASGTVGIRNYLLVPK
jgi:arylsulfatase A-like enzyme